MRRATNKFAKCLAGIVAICGIGRGAAQAAQVNFDFNELGGTDSSSYFELQKSGFRVTVSGPGGASEWNEAHTANLGNPVPAIWSGSHPSGGIPAMQLTVARLDNGPFTFQSADFAGFGPVDYLYDFLLNGASVRTNPGSIGSVNYLTYSDASNTVVDQLLINLTPGPQTGDVEVDNIKVTAVVPEPASLALLAVGMGLFARRRRLA